MSWVVRVTKSAAREIGRFPKFDQARIHDALGSFQTDPWQGDVAKIQGEDNLWRRRVGNYRIFYSVHTTVRVVMILEIARRTSTTY